MAKYPCNPGDENVPSHGCGSKTHLNESWLKIKEIMTLLNVSRDTTERWIKTGQLRAINIAVNSKTDHASWRIPSGAVEEFVQSRSTRPPVPKSTTRHRTPEIVEFVK